MRELLEPYFARIRFTSEQKRKWFRSREGLLFGFGIGFYILLRVPLLGVLIYGIAEAVSYPTSSLVRCSADPDDTERRLSDHQGIRPASAAIRVQRVRREPT